jgi:hypothetical protein
MTWLPRQPILVAKTGNAPEVLRVAGHEDVSGAPTDGRDTEVGVVQAAPARLEVGAELPVVLGSLGVEPKAVERLAKV